MRTMTPLKPKDLAVVYNILLKREQTWTYRQLGEELFISNGAISESIQRLKFARLLFTSGDELKVGRRALLEFTLHGIRYAFPTRQGSKVKGIPTSYNVSPLDKEIISNGVNMVWPSSDGQMSGYGVDPLYQNAPKAALNNIELHKILALVDAIRLGQTRPYNLAKTYLTDLIANKNYSLVE